MRPHPTMSPAELRVAMRHFLDLQISLAPASSVSFSQAADLAFRPKLTVYDAFYAVLAEIH